MVSVPSMTLLIGRIYFALKLLLARLRCLVLFMAGPVFFRDLSLSSSFHGFPRVARLFQDISIGSNVSIGRHLYILSNAGIVSIHSGVRINDYCFIASMHNIQIGRNTLIAEFVSIRDYDHCFSDADLPICRQGFRGAPIIIGSNVWIGRGTCILKGVSIGDNAIIGANSTVTKSIPANAIAFGSPAKVARMRK